MVLTRCRSTPILTSQPTRSAPLPPDACLQPVIATILALTLDALMGTDARPHALLSRDS
jgi:hypothetical protein